MITNLLSPEMRARRQLDQLKNQHDHVVVEKEVVNFLVELLARVFAAEDAAHYNSNGNIATDTQNVTSEQISDEEYSQLEKMLAEYPAFLAACLQLLQTS